MENGRFFVDLGEENEEGVQGNVEVGQETQIGHHRKIVHPIQRITLQKVRKSLMAQTKPTQ